MAGLGQRFNAQDHDTEQRGSNLPNGTYVLEVSASEVKPTAKGNGTILKLTYDVVEPSEFKGRKIFANINLENANSTAQEIGQRDLAKLCRAIGLNEVNDSDELHFISFTAKVGVEKPREGYEPRNEIKRFFYPDEGNVPAAEIDPNQPAQRSAPANDNRQQRTAANDNAASKPAGGAAAGTTRRPWGNK
ncbi:Protein of unknown function [Rhizobium sp. NFR07]|uniref:DUF669 domain-containing protein n=1 Tax=Rhizobium sp. NFR07 TaxID=1566262 RepID=UPI0008E3546C|nr:DUF669 domain-containing protein [Rhizobium sp. NFR07]SFB52593.1 Protein of unknown function [Rhizobium sp. NFR07]